MVVNPGHYRRLTVKQQFETENTLLREDNIVDFPIRHIDLSVYDAAAEVGHE
jgi:hypothetical protein